MNRLRRFESLRFHAMMGKDFKRLTRQEIDECTAFIAERAELSDSEFMHQANRWKLDQPEQRSKRHGIQWSLLISSVNTVANMENRKHDQND